jgi:hypothetical protein
MASVDETRLSTARELKFASIDMKTRLETLYLDGGMILSIDEVTVHGSNVDGRVRERKESIGKRGMINEINE